MLCHQTQALSKRGNLEQHHNPNHLKFKELFPLKTAIRTNKVEDLKLEFKSLQSLFVEPAVHHKAVTEASLHASHLLVEHKKAFTNGEVLKEAVNTTAHRF